MWLVCTSSLHILPVYVESIINQFCTLLSHLLVFRVLKLSFEVVDPLGASLIFRSVLIYQFTQLCTLLLSLAHWKNLLRLLFLPWSRRFVQLSRVVQGFVTLYLCLHDRTPLMILCLIRLLLRIPANIWSILVSLSLRLTCNILWRILLIIRHFLSLRLVDGGVTVISMQHLLWLSSTKVSFLTSPSRRFLLSHAIVQSILTS